ncbi:hypothetical protein BT93_L5084 [Corymbia citriodora subsp. variegata]|uniref:Uncharacterized protein n=1 Tax=Corymbia citriodora subsp. variegata TaxID=360336 RepID=A0A8T0CXG3_CORYI|nr:hypothetical protein BT93_L5084 [Corymbia citriodora subsp. variegata]
MDKLFSKRTVLLVLLVLALGWEMRVEARNVIHKCKTVKDCGDPARCKCPAEIKICVCHHPLGVCNGNRPTREPPKPDRTGRFWVVPIADGPVPGSHFWNR